MELPTSDNPVKVVEGDCREVLPSLPSGSFAAVIVDPPYGIGCDKVGSGTGGKGTFHRFTIPGSAVIEGDREPDGWWLADAFRVLKDGGFLFSFSRWDVDRYWHTAIEAAGFRVKNRAAWVKAHFGSGDLRGAYGFQHETVWVATKGRGELRGRRTGDVWRDKWTECIRHGKRHPFEKPLDLMRQIVRDSTDPGDLILDPFAGSGSTIAAASCEGRRAVGVEIDPAYAAIARRRVADAMGSGLLAGIA